MAMPLALLLRIEASVIRNKALRTVATRFWEAGTGFLPKTTHAPRALQLQRTAVAAAAQPSGDDSGGGEDQHPRLAGLTAPQCTAAIGQVMAAQANFVRVKIDRLDGCDGPPPRPRLLCVVRALLKKIKQSVVVGDHVRVVGIDWTDGRGMVEEVLPRQSRLAEPQVANVSQVLLVFSVDRPPLQPSAATRYLVTAEAAGLPITVVLNKVDLLTPGEAEAAAERVASWGYRTVAVSVLSGQGMTQLQGELRDKATVVAGPSGAGKSSIINALRLRSAGVEGTLGAMSAEPSGQLAALPAAVDGVDGSGKCNDRAEMSGGESQDAVSNGGNGGGSGGSHFVGGVELQAVGSVSERIGRGKHTTRNVTLMEMGGGGLVVDTPGFNQPDVSLPPAELAQHFPEIRRRLEEAGPCAFSNCQHLTEPGCVVRGDWERYELYANLHTELGAIDEALAARADGKRRREGMVRVKSRAGGRLGLEARLETKAHRRVSRRLVHQKLSDLSRSPVSGAPFDVAEEDE